MKRYAIVIYNEKKEEMYRKEFGDLREAIEKLKEIAENYDVCVEKMSLSAMECQKGDVVHVIGLIDKHHYP